MSNCRKSFFSKLWLTYLSSGPSINSKFLVSWHQVAMTPDCFSCPLTSFQDMLCSVRLHLQQQLEFKGLRGEKRQGGEAVFPLGNIRYNVPQAMLALPKCMQIRTHGPIYTYMCGI